VNGIGSGVTPPRVLEKVEPIYSEEARRAHLSGTVLLRGTVGIDGVIHDLATTRSLGMGLDEKAIQAVTTWQFQPGTKDGKPVAVLSNIEVNFRLGDDPRSISWHTARVEFLPPEGASRPLLEIARAIQTSGHGHATAALSFEVNEQGIPENIQVETASDDNWARDVITMLRSWRFTPGRKDGGATSAPSKMEFVRDN
jgi:TonB family protein